MRVSSGWKERGKSGGVAKANWQRKRLRLGLYGKDEEDLEGQGESLCEQSVELVHFRVRLLVSTEKRRAAEYRARKFC